MIKYDRFDFLEFFNSEITIDEAAGIYEYSTASKDDIALHVKIDNTANTALFKWTSSQPIDLVNFITHNIVSIRCDRGKPGLIRLLFYKKTKEEPSVDLCVKPGFALSINR